MNNRSYVVPVSESTAAGQARRTAMEFARRLGFNSVRTGEVGIIVTELANNLWRHAGEGEILYRALTSASTPAAPAPIPGLEILAIDRGPGMANVGICSRDGYSSVGGAGIGLGAVSRLSFYSEIYSRPMQGTVSLSQVWANPLPQPHRAELDVGVVCAGLKEEQVCGDAWAEKGNPPGRQLLLVDGLGHGPAAASAARAALETFAQQRLAGPEMVQALHVALKESVGAVVGLVEIAPQQQTLSFTGIGNIDGRIFWDEERQRLVSENGTVGCALQRVTQRHYPWHRNSLLILHTDGIASPWILESYPGLVTRHPALIAAVLYRDFRRERDDACVMVVRATSD